MLNAVGIDVSKGKSTVAVLQPADVVVRKPFDVLHTKKELSQLVSFIRELDGETRIVMESTGHYHEPILKALSEADFFVSAVNPHLIKYYDNSDNPLRRVKSDPADARKIARYTLDRWTSLRQYSAMETTRSQLKTLNTQFQFFMSQKKSMKTNLISLLDLTYPGANDLFDSPVRDDGSEKWVDFAYSFWHAECVTSISQSAFIKRYQQFCKRHGYCFQLGRAEEIYHSAQELVPVVPKDMTYRKLIHQSIEQLRVVSKNIEQIRNEMNSLAAELPEYSTVMSMRGVGTTLGPQLIAEIGDINRFTHRTAITAYAGVDPGVDESGKRVSGSVNTSKAGNPKLRKTLFLIMSSLLQTAPVGDPVYDFMMKKKTEGKPYLVYMTAGANKFLRIYYGKVKAALKEQTSQN